MSNLFALVSLRTASRVTMAVCLSLGMSGAIHAQSTPAATPSVAPVASPDAAATAADAEVQSKLAEFDQYLEAGQGPAAMNVYQGLKLKYPNNPQVRAYEAKILALQNKMLEAVPVLETLLKDHPNHPLGTALMANIEYRMGKKEEAKKRVDDALVLHADSWELLQLSGEIKMADQQPILSLPIWQKIVANQSNPDTARMTAYAKLGVVYNGLGRYAEAAESLEKALAIKWHPSVNMGYIQALDQAKLYEKSYVAIADMRKQLAANNNPQIVQLRQQFEAQIGPIEARAKQSSVTSDLAALQADMTAGKIEYMSAQSRIRAIAKTIDKETDAARKTEQQLKLRELDLQTQVMLLKQGLERKYGLDWQKERVAEIQKLAVGLQGKHVDDAMALAKQVDANIATMALSQRDSVLDLAGKGWSLKDFRSPDTKQLNELKDRGLPERYDHFSSDLRKALKEFYTPLAEKREMLELEQVTAEFLKAPTDKALQAKVAKLLTARVAEIDISKEGVSKYDVIPARIWTEPPQHTRTIDLDEKTYDRRELAYSINTRTGKYNQSKNNLDEALIEGYTRAIASYPRPEILSGRGAVYMHTGRFREAWEDFAASVAVAAWEEANAQRDIASMGTTWALNGIPQVVVMDQIVKGKIRIAGLYPAASINAMLVGMQGKNWPAVADLIMQTYDTKSFELRILADIRDGRHRDEIIDTLVDRYRQATSEEFKKAILDKAKYLQSYHSHLALDMLNAELEKDPSSRTRFLQGAVFAEPRNVAATYALAKQYEADKHLEDAMLVYNIAAGGKLLTQTSGIAREAATARDRLSGPMANIKEALKVYEPHMNNINKMIMETRANKIHASQYEAIVLLFLNYNGNRKALVGRLADAQRAMGFYAQANENLKEYAKLLPEHKGMAMALMAKNEVDLGQYEQAIKNHDAAIAAGYKESWVYTQRGHIQVYLGHYKEAIESYTLAIEKKADNTDAMNERSELYEYFLKDYDKAIVDLEKVLGIFKEKNPDGNFFSQELRLNNMKVIQSRKALGL